MLSEATKAAITSTAKDCRRIIKAAVGVEGTDRPMIALLAAEMIKQELDETGADMDTRGGALLYFGHVIMAHPGDFAGCQACIHG